MLDTVLAANSDIRRVQSLAARALSRIGISANAATIAGTIMGVAAAIEFGRGSTTAGIAALAISAALDAIDGTIAREAGASSPLGGVLDLTSDRVVEILVIVGIAQRDSALFFPALLLVGSWYVNITIFLAVGAALDREGPKLIDYPPGILERSEALIFFVVLAIVEAAPLARPLGPYLCYAMTAMEIATGVQRLIFGVRMLRAQ
ncbi:MAG: CDP-alcohol phosphatidyltransferase family protein [Candidatus Binatus sp.]|uniref:CDP-alcohol phosphatidyltransferase family protein n=1 Tax=Candidatus Binatus sp. TaxID=2811406 RepID=UPI002723163F|nr:CDP-alcohol phosphatidyltransferase family protein [Candidatus Binatus sp.]MDO8434915.1 CDP-alcohol phosphatidyltransferase family protein [Candidatus Binatus sp.]